MQSDLNVNFQVDTKQESYLSEVVSLKCKLLEGAYAEKAATESKKPENCNANDGI